MYVCMYVILIFVIYGCSPLASVAVLNLKSANITFHLNVITTATLDFTNVLSQSEKLLI